MVVVREFCDGYESTLVEILKLNHQYGSPGVDGPGAMRRVARCSAAEFLVAEEGESAVGFVRGVHDGSRAVADEPRPAVLEGPPMEYLEQELLHLLEDGAQGSIPRW